MVLAINCKEKFRWMYRKPDREGGPDDGRLLRSPLLTRGLLTLSLRANLHARTRAIVWHAAQLLRLFSYLTRRSYGISNITSPFFARSNICAY